MPRQLPDHADLTQLKNQAKDLVKAHKLGDPEALGRIVQNHPRFAQSSPQEIQNFRFTLSGAQLVIAREYGFASWPKLKAHVLSAAPQADDPVMLFKQAMQADDAARARRLFERKPALKALIHEPLGPFDSPAIVNVRSREMLDVLLDAGADLNAKSRWWAGGFGLLHVAKPEIAAYAIQRGAIVDVHAAARLGLLDRLRELLDADPALVYARGGDGQTALHFASTREVAALLLERGADIDARDVDHESTPAQYMLDHRHNVAGDLVRRGCKTDLLMAAALGDVELVRRHLEANPDCIRLRAAEEFFPMTNHRAGGSIYLWVLGRNTSAHQAAAKFGHADVLHLLMEFSTPQEQLLAACWLHDRAMIDALRTEHPGLVESLSESQRQEIAHAARNNNTQAVCDMLDAGLPVVARGQHRATPLHWAAWHGNLEMVKVILRFGPPLEDTENDYHATPLGWATHGSENGWYCQTGRYPDVVEALLQAGAVVPLEAVGTKAVREVLRRYGAMDRADEAGT
jgi:ankyrin repeat protein